MAWRSMRSVAASIVRERVVRRLLPYEVISYGNRNDRAGALHRAWGHVFSNQLEGAYYEFGVYRGASFRTAVRAYQELAAWARAQTTSDETWRRQAFEAYSKYPHAFYAFDTFSGIPTNAEGRSAFAAGYYTCSLDEFRRLNREEGIEESVRIRYFQGRFADIAQQHAETLAGLQPAAIVNIDCDLYASARDALDIVMPKLLQGSALLFDDWNNFAADRDRGERRAAQEFLERHPAFSLEPWFPYAHDGQAFLVHRNHSA